jgi:hypothetical protein
MTSPPFGLLMEFIQRRTAIPTATDLAVFKDSDSVIETIPLFEEVCLRGLALGTYHTGKGMKRPLNTICRDFLDSGPCSFKMNSGSGFRLSSLEIKSTILRQLLRVWRVSHRDINPNTAAKIISRVTTFVTEIVFAFRIASKVFLRTTAKGLLAATSYTTKSAILLQFGR